ncbi:MAG: hypothetical protein LUI87_05675 [Lachnospiraceae bacterium]|nr:hypothetical protein [Lachnospiraceae bacterium]
MNVFKLHAVELINLIFSKWNAVCSECSECSIMWRVLCGFVLTVFACGGRNDAGVEFGGVPEIRGWMKTGGAGEYEMGKD